MASQGITRHGLIAAIVAVFAIGAAAAETAGGGELRIEGQGIEQLILTGPGDQTRTFEPPGPTATADVHVAPKCIYLR